MIRISLARRESVVGLGKRTDFSGRAPLVTDPDLDLRQCSLPLDMALELFRPQLLRELHDRGLAATAWAAGRALDRRGEDVLDILEALLCHAPVILARSSPLERHGVAAFEPMLGTGRAIGVHPLAATLLDVEPGDVVALHLPMSGGARREARALMSPLRSLRRPADGKPLIVPGIEALIGLFALSIERPGTAREATFANSAEVLAALEADLLDVHERVRVRVGRDLVVTTPGRLLIRDATAWGSRVPRALWDTVLDRRGLDVLLEASFHELALDDEAVAALVRRLHDLGVWYASRSGLSLSAEDLRAPKSKAGHVARAQALVAQVQGDYWEGLITDGERYNKTVDIWAETADRIAMELGEDDAHEGWCSDLLAAATAVDGRGNGQRRRRMLSGMVGLCAKHSGDIAEVPVVSSLSEGLSPFEFFLLSIGARHGNLEDHARRRRAENLAHRLREAVRHVVITEEDCGAIGGREVEHLMADWDVLEPVHRRVVGRVALEDVTDPVRGNVLIRAGEVIDESGARSMAGAGVTEVVIRSPLGCEARGGGLCARCYGRDVSTGKMAEEGSAVGVIAAQSIAALSERLVTRYFHIGGWMRFGPVVQSACVSRNAGRVLFEDIESVENREGKRVVVSRAGSVSVVDELGRRREEHWARYGSILEVDEGQVVERGTMLAECDPYAEPIVTEAAGMVRFVDLVEGRTLEELVDEVTGLSIRRVVEDPDDELEPALHVVNAETGDLVSCFFLGASTALVVEEDGVVCPGDVLARTPLVARSRTEEGWRGPERLDELLEARRSPDRPWRRDAVLARVDGVVSFSYGPDGRADRVIVTPRSGIAGEHGEPLEYPIDDPFRHLAVRRGDRVRSGDVLVSGELVLSDLLEVQGGSELAHLLVDELQVIFVLQGIRIAPAHLEVVVREMLRRVRVTDAGDTMFVIDDVVEGELFQAENDRVCGEGGRPATAAPVILGITEVARAREERMFYNRAGSGLDGDTEQEAAARDH